MPPWTDRPPNVSLQAMNAVDRVAHDREAVARVREVALQRLVQAAAPPKRAQEAAAAAAEAAATDGQHPAGEGAVGERADDQQPAGEGAAAPGEEQQPAAGDSMEVDEAKPTADARATAAEDTTADGAAATPAAPADAAAPADVPPVGREDAQRLCSLFAVLCARDHSLLLPLAEAYAVAGPGCRAALEDLSGNIAGAVGFGSPRLLDLLEAPPPGSEPLLLAMLQRLTENGCPPSVVSLMTSTYQR